MVNAACGDGYDNQLIIKTLQKRNPQTPAIFGSSSLLVQY